MILNFPSTQLIKKKKQLRAGTVSQGQGEPLPSMLEVLGSKFPVFPMCVGGLIGTLEWESRQLPK